MSETEQPITDFEQLLESVSPADPKGSPMQIMYLAGQQAATASNSLQPANRLWQLATLASSIVAAGMLIFVSLLQPAFPLDQSIVQTNAVEDTESIEIIAVEQDLSFVQTRPLVVSLRSSQAVRNIYDPIKLAQASLSRSSIDMFDDFEIKPTEVQGWGRENRQ